MYALCVSGTVTTQGFVRKFFMRHTFSFIQSTSPTGCRFLYCDPLQDGRWFQDGVTFEDG